MSSPDSLNAKPGSCIEESFLIKTLLYKTTVCVILSLILSWDFECASFSLHSVLISLPDLLCEPLFNTCSYTERMTSTSRPDLLLFSSWAFSWLENWSILLEHQVPSAELKFYRCLFELGIMYLRQYKKAYLVTVTRFIWDCQ